MLRRAHLVPRLVIICVDGATPSTVDQHCLLRFDQTPLDDHRALQRLRTIYPSSTAPAHASMLTGTPPAIHGIVGNRFWDNDIPHITDRAYADPLATIHPYDRASLQTASFLDHLQGQGLRVSAVLFPLTFSVSNTRTNIDSAYCLYAPSKNLQVRWQTTASEQPSTTRNTCWELSYFGMKLVFSLSLTTEGHQQLDIIDSNVQQTHIVKQDSMYDIYAYQATSSLTFTMRVKEIARETIMVHQSTAVLTLCFGSLKITDVVNPSNPPHSRQIDYAANPHHAFYESPAVAWVTQTSLKLLQDPPDVLLIRYSQVDHAQEYLYWYAVNGTPAERTAANVQILETYWKIEQGIHHILTAIDPQTPFYIFSDHGIDIVDTHIYINTMLDELGLANEFVFQGDSSCCYLYGTRSLSRAEVTSVYSFLQAHLPRVWRSSPDELRQLQVYYPSRCGQLVLRCGRHTEFQYGSGPLVMTVQSASHGFAATVPEMDGIWLPFRNVQAYGRTITSIVDLADLTTHLCRTSMGR